MPSFDIVSEIDMQEVRNAVENATRDLGTRWDFRNVPASFELNEKDQSIKVATESDFGTAAARHSARKAEQAQRRRRRAGDPEEFTHSGKTYSVEAKLKQGLKPLWRRKSSS